MSAPVQLWSAPESPHVGMLELSEAQRRRSEFVCTASLEIDGERSSIGLDMISPYLHDMAGFFDELAAAVDGWHDVKCWESEFSEMTVWMRNNGQGLVAADVLLRWPPRYEEERTGSFLARAAELRRFSSQFLRVARLERGERFTFFGDAGKCTLPGWAIELPTE